MRAIVHRYTPPAVWNVLRKVKATFESAMELRDPLMPPRRTHAMVGHGDFRRIGEKFLEYFIRFGLKPEHDVLDVGCGIGRMAIPLTRFLKGRYEGFDIVEPEIDWCSGHITPRFPNFYFQVADIYNKAYNPQGKQSADSYSFPYSDKSFDFVYLTSVFTHMLPKQVSRYLSEIRRVLRPSGTCLATCFLLNEESENLIVEGKSKLNFIHSLEGCTKTTNPLIPEDAVAYSEEEMRKMIADAALVLESVQYGSWCQRATFLSYQDILILH